VQLDHLQELEEVALLCAARARHEHESGAAFDVLLVDLNVVHLLGNLIAREQKLRIKEEALMVSIAVLLGGNEKCQRKFHEHIKHDDGNALIISLKDMLSKSMNELLLT
jgi:hypothetical protein